MEQLSRITDGAPLVDRLWSVASGAIIGTIHGILPNKSNSRRLVKIAGQPRLIKSREALEYEERFRIAVLGSSLPQEPLVGATTLEDVKKGVPFLFLRANVFGESLMRDLDCELVPDLLQKFDVVKNDRAIRLKHYEWALDRENPRIEFIVGIMPENKEGEQRGKS